MEKHYSLRHAERVLALLRKALPKAISKLVDIRCWANGREQGFHLYLSDPSYKNTKGVVFAQQRNSDNVLVVPGKSMDFDISTNQPSDEAWENRKEFSEDKEAVKFIVKFFKGA